MNYTLYSLIPLQIKSSTNLPKQIQVIILLKPRFKEGCNKFPQKWKKIIPSILFLKEEGGLHIRLTMFN